VPVIALSQLSRNVENRLNKRPVLSDLRESGTIEQDADLVLMLYRDNYYKNSNIINNDTIINQAELLITKQRNGPTGKLNLKFNSKINKFLNDYDSY
jgi:replicative DNA helicase